MSARVVVRAGCVVAFVTFVPFVVDGRAQDFMPRPEATLQGATLRVTLEDAQARAEQASHRLAEARAREATAQAAFAVIAAADTPLVSASAGYTRTNHVTAFFVPTTLGQPPALLYPDVPDNYRTRLDLQW